MNTVDLILNTKNNPHWETGAEKGSDWMKIERTRYVVMRKNRTEIWCGLSRDFHFVKIDELKDTAIKTYRTRKQAESGCSSWERDFEVVECKEIIDIKE